MIEINDKPIRATISVINMLVKDMDAVQDWPEYASYEMIRDSMFVAAYADNAKKVLWRFVDETNRHNTRHAMREAGVTGRR